MTESAHNINFIPNNDPTLTTADGYNVHIYETDEIVPDIIIWQREGDEHVRIWGFQASPPLLVLAFHSDHKHPPEFETTDCREWSLYDDAMPPLEAAPETPDRVMDLAARYSDAPVADKTRHLLDDDLS